MFVTQILFYYINNNKSFAQIKVRDYEKENLCYFVNVSYCDNLRVGERMWGQV